MASYAAVISLKQTILRFLYFHSVPLTSSTGEILGSADKHATCLQKLLCDGNGRSSGRLADLDVVIRDCANELEDFLEFYELQAQHRALELRKAITAFAETVKKVEVEYIEELSKPVDDDATVSSYPDFGVEMVDLTQKFVTCRNLLLHRLLPHNLCFILFLGEVNSGRKIVATTIFEDLREEFECCAWVTVGKERSLKEVLIQIIAQVDSNPGNDDLFFILKDEEEICNYLIQALEHRRYMIVLDDVCRVQVVEYLRRSLPNRSDGSIVCLISSLSELKALAEYVPSFGVPAPYFAEATWLCMRNMMFGFKQVPPKLEDAGKRIIENCRGNFISAAKMVLFLYKTKRTAEEWSKIAADKENPIFVVGDEISERHTINTEVQSYNWDLDNQSEKSFVDNISEMVNSDTLVQNLMMAIHPKRFFSRMLIISILGMAGIGKSALARKLFKDQSIIYHYDHCVWVTLGPKYQSDEVLIDILAQTYPNIDKLQMKEDAELTQNLCVLLSDKRFFIVLDDLWSKEPLHHLRNVFPNIVGTTLVTTREAEVAHFVEKDDMYIKMEFLNKEESWRLLRQKVFGEGPCTRELEKAGRKIAENCDGLPLLILTVADQLHKLDEAPDPEYWNFVASGKEKSVFKNAHDEISKGLGPSYKILSQNLKACFLYIGVFRLRYKIPIVKLTHLLIAEGFLKLGSPQKAEDDVVAYLHELVDQSMVIANRSLVSDFHIKTCRLHSVFWHFANCEATGSKFFHVINSYADCLVKGITSHRRLCIRNSILLGMKDVKDSMISFTTAHSLLCVGTPHQYAVPIDFNLRLLRVMDAVTIRLYEFPVEVVKLFHLRYLGLTCNGNLPSSISGLWKLECLIVRRYINIKSSQDFTPLPAEIWHMSELVHLEVEGGILPNPRHDCCLSDLLTLLGMSARSCTKKVLKRIPNLRRLGVQIELLPNKNGNPFHSLNRISRLRRLESLKCVVMNPQIGSEIVAPPAPISMFPSSLRKLSLSGFGYPWKYTSIIGGLKNLKVLKLKHYAFQGPKWVLDHQHHKFEKLDFLLVEDTNLVHWESNMFFFQQLKHLRLKHCYKLQEIPMFLSKQSFARIKVVDCNPSVVTWAGQMDQMSIHMSSQMRKVEVNLSWMKRKEDSNLDD